MESFGVVFVFVALSLEHDPSKEAKEYPYIVSIHENAMDYNYVCAGTLISSTWVLTSANCLSDLAYKIRYGDMIEMNETLRTYSRILKKLPYPNTRVVIDMFAIQHNLQFIKTNDIALAMVEKVPDIEPGLLSALDYSSLIGHKVMYFEFGFDPVFRAKVNKSKLKETLPKKIKKESKKKKVGLSFRAKKKSPTTKRKNKVVDAVKKILPKKKKDEKKENATRLNDTLLVQPTHNIDEMSIKVLHIGEAVVMKCPSIEHPGPSICIASECFNFNVDDPWAGFIWPDFGGPLLLDKKIVGISSEIIEYYTYYTPISPYLKWITDNIRETE